MELGSEFNLNFQDLEEKEDHIFNYLKDYNCIYTDSGRSALRILERIIPKQGKILLPSYTCDSVIECYEEDQIEYYNLDYELNIIWQQLDSLLEQEVAAVVVMHYFGKMQDKEVLAKLKEKCKQKNIMIIEDTTHSIFTQPCSVGDYCICSLRKWFAIPDGGVLYSLKGLPEIGEMKKPEWSLNKTYGMFLKSLFLEKEYDCNSWYRELFAEAEEQLEHQKDICEMSKLSKVLLLSYSIQDMISNRRSNYKKVENGLKDYGILFWTEMSECPLVCPITIENRNELRRYLIEQQIYCAVHWPVTRQELTGIEVVDYIAKHIMSLPIDQRYGEEHIEYLLKILSAELERRRGDKR